MIILYTDGTGIWTRTLDRSDSRGPERSVVFGWKFDFCPDRDMAWRGIECDKVLCGVVWMRMERMATAGAVLSAEAHCTHQYTVHIYTYMHMPVRPGNSGALRSLPWAH